MLLLCKTLAKTGIKTKEDHRIRSTIMVNVVPGVDLNLSEIPGSQDEKKSIVVYFIS